MCNSHRHLYLILFSWCLSIGGNTGLCAGELITLTGKSMGTTYSVKLSALPEGVTQATLQAEIDRCLDTINRHMSTWIEDSEISRFNRYRDTDWFPVSSETAFVVKSAIEVSQQTEGAFDVTVGPLVNLWGFGPDPAGHALPEPARIEAAHARVGYRFLEARDDPPALRKSRADVSVDLSAIAKGFGVDQVAAVLEKRSITNFMVEIGGEIRAEGVKPDGTPWRIGIETPTPFSRGIQRAVALTGQSMATSGDYRNFVVIDGKRYSHTIDPKTGWPVDHQLTSVSVIAENCMLADAYATAIVVLGPDEGYHWAEQKGLAALLIVRDGERFLEKPTRGFEEMCPVMEESSGMTTWLAAFGAFLLVMLAFSLGMIFRSRCSSGSCRNAIRIKSEDRLTPSSRLPDGAEINQA
jgi:thiamine biosynthesis lipoprotein